MKICENVENSENLIFFYSKQLNLRSEFKRKTLKKIKTNLFLKHIKCNSRKIIMEIVVGKVFYFFFSLTVTFLFCNCFFFLFARIQNIKIM